MKKWIAILCAFVVAASCLAVYIHVNGRQQIDGLNQDLADREKEIESLTQQAETDAKTIQELTGKVTEAEETITVLTAENDGLKAQIVELEDNLSDSQVKLQSILDIITGAPAGETAAAVRFTDVPEDSPYFSAVAAMTEKGLMAPVSEDVFGVDQPAALAEWAQALCALRGENLSGEEAIEALVQSGILTLAAEEAAAEAATEEAAETVEEAAEETAEEAAEAVETAEEIVEEAAETVEEIVEDAAETAAEAAEDAAETVEEAAAEETAEAAETVEESAEEAAEETAETAETAEEAAEETAEEAAETVEGTAEEAAETVEEAVEEAAEKVTETVEEVVEEAAETVEEAAAEEAAETAEEVAEEAAEEATGVQLLTKDTLLASFNAYCDARGMVAPELSFPTENADPTRGDMALALYALDQMSIIDD